MFRKDLIPVLLDQPLAISQIARLVRETPAQVESDVAHLLQSLRHTEYHAEVIPARCRKCGFVFNGTKLTKPSKCPECRGTWIHEPRVALHRRDSA